MRLIYRLAVFISLLLLAAGPATGAVVWDEAAHGDLNSSLGLQVDIAIGTNIIRGTATDRVGVPTDSDQFVFRIPDGAELRSASYTYALGDFVAGTTTLHSGLGISSLSTFTVLSPFQLVRMIDGGVAEPSGVFGFPFNYTPTQGDYRFDNTASARSGDGGGSWNWEVTLEVDQSVVPLPGAGLLLGGALFGLAGLSARQTPRAPR